MKRIFSLVLILIVVFVSLVGCSKSKINNGEEGITGIKPIKVALIAGGKFGDNGMNDALLAGMEIFEKDTGIKVTSVEVNEFGDNALNARNFGQQGYDLVIMGAPVSEIIPEIANEFPETHFVLNKGTIADLENVTSVNFEEAQAGFLTGAFAVLMSEELGGINKTGWVGGMRIPDLERARYSYVAGAKYVGGESSVAYVGSFTDIAKGKELALQMYGDGALIVQAYAGAAANGVYQAVEGLENGRYALGAATGQFHLSPERIIASAVLKTDEAFAMITNQFMNGELLSGIIIMGLVEDSTGIKFNPELEQLIPQEIKDKVEEIRAKIISGDIVPPTNEEEFDAFVNSL